MTVKQKIAKLIDVKSIMTLMLTAVFGILSLRGDIDSDQFLTIFAVIVSFFFGTKSRQDNITEDGVEKGG